MDEVYVGCFRRRLAKNLLSYDLIISKHENHLFKICSLLVSKDSLDGVQTGVHNLTERFFTSD